MARARAMLLCILSLLLSVLRRALLRDSEETALKVCLPCIRILQFSIIVWEEPSDGRMLYFRIEQIFLVEEEDL